MHIDADGLKRESERVMKRTIKLVFLTCLILLVSALVLTACDITDFLPISGGTTPEKTTPMDTTPVVTPPEETTPEETTPEETTPEETTPSTGEHAHAWSEWITVKAATCEEIGLTQRYCTVCFYTESQPINALGHTEVLDEAVAPTCTEIGFTEGKHCSVCNKVFVAQEVIPAKNHQYENTVCTRCGYSQYIIFDLSSEGDSYKVRGVESNYLSSLVIPSTYLGKPVTSIGYEAFYYCTGLTSITISDSVTSIGEHAFSGCSVLASVTFGENSQLTSIGSSVFEDCGSLTSITIPDSVTSIGLGAFSGCSGLASVTFGENSQLTSIGSSVFEDCSSLTSITIPDSVTSIGNYAFYGCSSLTSITIPDGVTNINSATFYSCSSLTSITIPDSVTSISNHAFSLCSNLTSITFEGTVEQWNAITFGSYWNGRVPATEVVCSDGAVTLN